MATLCITPHNTHFSNKSEEAANLSLNTINLSAKCSASASSEPPKISKFFSNSSNYQSKIQQLISFSFTSSNFIFITFILSISKLCTTAATDPAQAGAPQPSTAAPPGFLMHNLSSSALLEKLNSFRASTVGPPTTVKGKHAAPAPGNSLTTSHSNSSANGGGQRNNSSHTSATSAKSSHVPSPTSSPSSNVPSSSSSLDLFGSNGNGFLDYNRQIKFLNISGKAGTPLGVGKYHNAATSLNILDFIFNSMFKSVRMSPSCS